MTRVPFYKRYRRKKNGKRVRLSSGFIGTVRSSYWFGIRRGWAYRVTDDKSGYEYHLDGYGYKL